jgi:hypothetical protein
VTTPSPGIKDIAKGARGEPEWTADMPRGRPAMPLGCMHRARGWVLLLSSAAVGLLGWWVLHLLSEALRQDQDQANAVGDYVLWMTRHQTIIPALAIPPLLCGLWLALVPSRRAAFWVAWVLGTLWLIGVFFAVLIAFINFLTPLYTYHPI